MYDGPPSGYEAGDLLKSLTAREGGGFLIYGKGSGSVAVSDLRDGHLAEDCDKGTR